MLRAAAHLLPAVVWVGAQLGLAWLRPRAARADSDELWDVTEQLAAAGWVAYWLLWLTGIVNLVAAGDATQQGRYGALVLAKIGAVTASGLVARAALDATNARWLRVGAMATALAALAALLLGIALTR